MSIKSRSIRPSCLAAALVAATVAYLVGAGMYPRASHAMQFSVPPGGTIQGDPICGTSPSTNDVLTFGGTNWCGAQHVDVTGWIRTGGAICAGNNTDCSAASPGDVISDPSASTGAFVFGNGASSITYNTTLSNAINLGARVGINGDTATMSAAPRMYLSAAMTLAANPAGGILQAWIPPKAITIDNCTMTWHGWTGCTTFPTVQVGEGGGPNVICTQTLDATGSNGTAETVLFSGIAAADQMSFTVSTAGSGCSQAAGVGRLSVSLAYHMQ